MKDRHSVTSTTDHSTGVDRRSLLRLAAVTGITAATAGQLSTARAEIWEEGDEQCRVQQARVAPLPDLDEALLADFVSASETLTGQRPLSGELAHEYLERFARQPDYFPKLKRLLELHKTYSSGGNATPDEVANRIMKNTETDGDDIRAAAEQLIYLWYVSAFFLQARKEDPPGSGKIVRTGPQIWIYGTSEQYEQALLWKVVKAHPPMMPGGKPGYWANPAV